MYGLLNQALQSYVVSTYGAATWETIAPGVTAFERMQPYPDDLTSGLVARAALVLGRTTDDVLASFGEHWVKYTDAQGYRALFDIAGPDLLDFIESLNTLHARVQHAFPGLNPPVFVSQRFVGGLHLAYTSERRGLCPIVPGILRGLAYRFRQPIDITETACARFGDKCCLFTVTTISSGESGK